MGNASSQPASSTVLPPILQPFYDSLNRPAEKDVRANVEKVAHPDWRSHSGEKISKGREEFINQVIGFGKLIPDLKWDVKEVIRASPTKYIVRSQASGTPVDALFGVPASGKSFDIMAIDIHTIRDGKLVLANHVEDWATALKQLKA